MIALATSTNSYLNVFLQVVVGSVLLQVLQDPIMGDK